MAHHDAQPAGLTPLPTAPPTGDEQIVRPAWIRLFRFGLWTLICTVIPALALLLVDQARDASRAMAMDRPGRLLLTSLIAAISSLIAWRMMRLLQERVLNTGESTPTSPAQEQGDWFVRHYPRLLGFVPLTGVLVQYAILSVETSLGREIGAWAEAGIAAIILGSAAVAIWFVIFGFRCAAGHRRSANDDGRIPRWHLDVLFVALVIIGVLLGLTAMRVTTDPTRPGIPSVLSLSTAATWMILVALYARVTLRREATKPGIIVDLLRNPASIRWLVGGLTLLLTVLTTLTELAHNVGPIAVLLLGAGCWCALGNWLILEGLDRRIGRWHGLPILSAVLAVSVVVGLTIPGTNNLVRVVESTADQPRTLLEAYNTYNTLPNERAPSNGPIVVIAAEGGGIYAAYHSATLLGQLEDVARKRGEKAPRPSDVVFAMSGVSGGAVGLGIYTALINEARIANPAGSPEGHPFSFEEQAKKILDADLLSPVLAAGLGRDLLPIPAPILDRSRALEDALVDSWNQTVPTRVSRETPLLLQPVNALRESKDSWTPLLVFNTTRVSQGSPYYISSLDFDVPPPTPKNNDAQPTPASDHTDRLGRPTRLRIHPEDHDVPLVTAMFMSARFPIATSSARATFHDSTNTDDHPGCPITDSFVDGGYFENVGCASALEIVQQLLTITNETREIRVCIIRSESAGSDEPFNGGDLIAPLSALANTRGAHGRGYRRRLEQLAQTNPMVSVRSVTLDLKPEGKIPIPLGWMLSSKTREIIDQQQTEESIEALWNWMTGAPIKPAADEDP